MKRAIIVVLLLAAMAIAVLAVRSTGQQDKGAAAGAAYPPVKVALAPAQREQRARSFAGVGALEAARQVDVAAEVGGRVTRILFESGQQVKEGQLLVQLNDAVEQAELLRLQAQLRNAELLHARMRKLMNLNATAQQQLDDAQAQRDMALGDVRQMQAKIAQKAIRAPFSGAIGIRRVHEGQYLNAAETVVNLVDAGTLRVNFSLDEQTSAGLALGQAVAVQVAAYPDRAFPAAITAIDPLIDKSRTVQVQATLANPDGALKAGMYAGIRVTQRQSVSVLTVPETALTYTAYGDTVFLAQQNGKGMTVKRVSVTVGERNDGRVEILRGLREGDRVVTSGQLKLSDGMAAEPVAQDTLSAAPAGSSGDK
ncbi:efflux RND transporter periplasmic adaptor subunit [Serratia entomophila]|uniref:Efflux RND transporter periplasmic adaptor subunit n=1 Tax=Serratia entomophila TaxID=42906 RepID=A0ABY5CYD5_9GAMM|nr:efflux RND transporter periplasmic adaptor subunit [Serratia entomophila]USV02589.1 efflux RND transporter periplasmic adaptor subunit [Serratia entomophila]CAI0737541.1 Efflux pump periplasmic linker BepF [Serratia entomophila]CAI0747120.1 Efflux pump periplasmic linker BepF [Serratia entomophila]CAI0835950.1 Efflux pump periplasmic linker BepF [Serratia entomophila]CAI0846850.1 Efflux pump periplasmic linker BepF [Serratia entomophila]